MMEKIIKIIKYAEKQRHNNHVNASKKNWLRVRQEAKKEVFDILLNKANYIPLIEANNIHYGHQNDTLEMAYLRGRTEIINLITEECYLSTFPEKKNEKKNL